MTKIGGGIFGGVRVFFLGGGGEVCHGATTLDIRGIRI